MVISARSNPSSPVPALPSVSTYTPTHCRPESQSLPDRVSRLKLNVMVQPLSTATLTAVKSGAYDVPYSLRVSSSAASGNVTLVGVDDPHWAANADGETCQALSVQTATASAETV